MKISLSLCREFDYSFFVEVSQNCESEIKMLMLRLTACCTHKILSFFRSCILKLLVYDNPLRSFWIEISLFSFILISFCTPDFILSTLATTF